MERLLYLCAAGAILSAIMSACIVGGEDVGPEIKVFCATAAALLMIGLAVVIAAAMEV